MGGSFNQHLDDDVIYYHQTRQLITTIMHSLCKSNSLPTIIQLWESHLISIWMMMSSSADELYVFLTAAWWRLIINYHQSSSSIIINHQQSSSIIMNHHQSSWIIMNHHQSSSTPNAHTRILRRCWPEPDWPSQIALTMLAWNILVVTNCEHQMHIWGYCDDACYMKRLETTAMLRQTWSYWVEPATKPCS